MGHKDEALALQRTAKCCGLIRTKRNSPTRAIPLYNVLWAELSDFELDVSYVSPTSKDVVRVTHINYSVDKTERAKATRWIELLLHRAYGQSQLRKRIKVLINPFGGQGSAQKWYLRDIEPIFAAARCEIDVERTQHQGHAVTITQNLDTDKWDVIASCSGDGLPHEVFNGLAQKPDASKALAKLAVVQLPCGSGNAMSWNLNGTASPSMAALAVVKGIRTPLDLVSITQGDRRFLSFLSQSVGIVAESDLATEHLRWLGESRFTYGFLVRLLGKTVYPCDIALKVAAETKPEIRQLFKEYSSDKIDTTSALEDERIAHAERSEGLPALRFGTVQDPLPEGWVMTPYPTIGNFYAGNMAYMTADANFFQASLPHDGCLDLVCIDGNISRLAAVKSLMAVENGTFFDMPHVSYRKIEGYRIIPKERPGKEGYISIDGERVPFEPFQVEVHRGLGTVLSRSGQLYESPPLPALKQ